jgi:hypothetical protein
MNRRALLRGALAGAAVSVPLPVLEAMLNVNGDALAGGEALPDRFGVWFWGNGVKPEHWVPSTTGAGWAVSEELAGLADVRDYVSVVSGCEIKTETHPHHSGMTGIMTGMPYYLLGYTRDTIVSTFAAQSCDQLAADWFNGQTPFRSVEVGVTRFRGTDEGSTFEHLSHNGPNNPNPSEYDPVTLYERLFATPTDPLVDLARASVLDAVNGQVSDLKGRLGAADRTRLDQYLDSIRTLEQRLASGVGSCGVIDAPTSYPDVDGQEQIEQQNEVMSDLLALALACDLTRAFSVQFSTCGSGVVVWQVGATDSLHATCHEEPLPQPVVHAATTFTMDQFAVFLRALRDTPEGDGNLLDRCSILATTELSDGYYHSNTEYPIMIAGRGNGRLRGGYHYRSTSDRNTSDAVLTALHGAGVSLAGFGSDGGYTTSTISDLFT